MERVCRFAIHLLAWVASLGVAVAACSGVYFLSINNLEVRTEFAFFLIDISHWARALVCSLRGAQGSRAVVVARAHTDFAGPKELLCKSCPTGDYGKSVGPEGSEQISLLYPAAALPGPMVSLGTMYLWPGEKHQEAAPARPIPSFPGAAFVLGVPHNLGEGERVTVGP